MNAIEEAEDRRGAILEEIRDIRRMRRGSVNEQYLKVSHKNEKEPVLRGPYYVFTRSEKGRTVSWRLRTQADIEQAQEDVAAYKRFKLLCQELEELTERLGDLEQGEGATSKKNASGRGRGRPRSEAHH